MKRLILLFLILLIKKILLQCSNSNCPIDNGKCINNICQCNYSYVTLNYNGIYCNYKKTSKWIPFILEIFFPSLGHFYIGKFYLGLFKLFFLLFPIFLSLLPCSQNRRIKDPCFNILSFIILFCFFVEFCLLVSDPFLYIFKYYLDGNGVELA